MDTLRQDFFDAMPRGKDSGRTTGEPEAIYLIPWRIAPRCEGNFSRFHLEGPIVLHVTPRMVTGVETSAWTLGSPLVKLTGLLAPGPTIPMISKTA
jgi:hypothetical protein